MLETTAGARVSAMKVRQVTVSNFRNYAEATVSLDSGKTILIGENAQGKSNFLEAIEIVSAGKSPRAARDADLIRWGADKMSIDISFERQGIEETVFFGLSAAGSVKPGSRPYERHFKVNGVTYKQSKALLGHLVIVSFKSLDLNLLRGGPKCRREWIDEVIFRLRPSFTDVASDYQKTVSQRNRLLKMLFEKRRLTVTDSEQLLAWDKQLARFGARIIKERLKLLSEILPRAALHQSHLSGKKEVLQADYLFKAPEPRESDEPDCSSPEVEGNGHQPEPVSVDRLVEADEREVAIMLLRLLKERRGEELARKQSLIGPHRDDVVLRLNGASAVDFASQGQQRSLVLSLKLAELEQLTESLGERPVLILDDVMAELDAGRQQLLMSAIGKSTQTIITTTHLAGFEPSWLEDATIFSVASGKISPASL